ncbi:hypothetical protein AZF37_02665 [endosymbiont 'TC1' of Trimyema compressum]|uniref:tyrosine-type recombinase/integrase n=1 Tax=endosymbiont 'TC1' of Trimyema compressum TaxID=243899 RepID=UPI0007F1853D|nr:tyrosine-type recombinase/integrase [endosymbiont 'TC1' of Trimyema compressum]AMP20221.1 hypothetical protein AZF37_02665 [endosymbiont 'TC1' of Trimyema compressum]
MSIVYTSFDPKTKSSYRTVSKPQKAFKPLLEYINECKRIDGYKDEWFLFGFTNPLPNTTIEINKNKACEECGLKKIRLHDFRHSHASLLINNNANIKLISNMVMFQ